MGVVRRGAGDSRTYDEICQPHYLDRGLEDWTTVDDQPLPGVFSCNSADPDSPAKTVNIDESQECRPNRIRCDRYGRRGMGTTGQARMGRGPNWKTR